MPRKKSTTVYRKLLREAWAITWQRKTLWIFGIFAGIVSSGGVIDVALNSLHRLKTKSTLIENLLDTSFIGYEIFGQYITRVQSLGQGTTIGIVTVTVLIALALIFAAVVSQAALVIGSKSKSDKHPHVLRKEAFAHVWDIFLIDLITKTLSVLLGALTTLPILLHFIHTSSISISLVLIQVLFYLPLVVIINLISVLSIIDIVDRGSKALDAIHTATIIFKKQWLATLEFAFLLFFIVLFAGIALGMLGTLLTVPFAIVYTSTLLTGSFTLFLIMNVLMVILFLLITLAIGGAIVTFHYSAWHRFYKRAMHRTYGSVLFAKMMRWVHS